MHNPSSSHLTVAIDPYGLSAADPQHVALLFEQDAVLQPLAVRFALEDKGLVLGAGASNAVIAEPDTTLWLLSWLLGRSVDDALLQKLACYLPLKLRGDERQHLAVVLGEQTYAPEEMLSWFFNQLRRHFHQNQQQLLSQLHLSVGCAMPASSKRSIEQAAHIVGLAVEQWIPQPAAALYHWQGQQKIEKKAIEDGYYLLLLADEQSLQAALCQKTQDTWVYHDHVGLALDDTTQLYMDTIDLMSGEYQQKHTNLSLQKSGQQRLWLAAREAFHALSQQATSTIHLPFLGIEEDDVVHFEMSLEGASFAKRHAYFFQTSSDFLKMQLRAMLEKYLPLSGDSDTTLYSVQKVLCWGHRWLWPASQEDLHALLQGDIEQMTSVPCCAKAASLAYASWQQQSLRLGNEALQKQWFCRAELLDGPENLSHQQLKALIMQHKERLAADLLEAQEQLQTASSISSAGDLTEQDILAVETSFDGLEALAQKHAVVAHQE